MTASLGNTAPGTPFATGVDSFVYPQYINYPLRPPNNQDFYIPGTRWQDNSVNPPVIYETVGKGVWYTAGSLSEAVQEFTGGPTTTGSFPVVPKTTLPDIGSIELNTTTTNGTALTILGGTNSLTLSMKNSALIAFLINGITQVTPNAGSTGSGIIGFVGTSANTGSAIAFSTSATGVLNVNLASNPIIRITGGTNTLGTFPVSPAAASTIAFSSNAGSIAITGSAQNINFDVTGFTGITYYQPVITGSIASGTFTPSDQEGTYTVSNGVCVCSFIVIATVSGLPSGDLRISLPKVCTQQNAYGTGYIEIGGVFQWIGPFQAALGNSYVTIAIGVPGVNQQIAATAYNIQGTITYFVG